MQDSKREELWQRLAPVVLEREQGFGNITVGGATDQQGKDNLLNFIFQELSKAREDGIREALEEINRTLGTNIKYVNGEYRVVFRRVSKLKDNK